MQRKNGGFHPAIDHGDAESETCNLLLCHGIMAWLELTFVSDKPQALEEEVGVEMISSMRAEAVIRRVSLGDQVS